MKPADFVNLLIFFFPWGYIKLATLILLAIYIVFSGVIVRQEQLMSKVVEIPNSPLLRVVAVIHLLVSLAVFLLVLVLL